MTIQSPAAGHHVRAPSPAPVWPALLERDREEVLADEVTRRRLERVRLARKSGTETVTNEVVKEEQLVRWMLDPPDHHPAPADDDDDDAGTSDYSRQDTGHLDRLGRTTSTPHQLDKGKGRLQHSASSTNLLDRGGNAPAPQTVVKVQDHSIHRVTATQGLFRVDSSSNDLSSRLSRAQAFSPLRLQSPHNYFTLGATIAPTAPQSGPLSHLHTYPSPPPSPSPHNARLARTGNFEFHPVIRAESHPLYVQPVKAIAVKRKRFAYAGNRWQRMRERDLWMRHRDNRDGSAGDGRRQ